MGLHSTVYLDVDGQAVAYGPGDEIPEAHARQIAAHAFEDGVHPFADGEAPVEEGQAGPPPKNGRTDAWAKYAADNGVQVEDGASRDAIIAACADADIPVDAQ